MSSDDPTPASSERARREAVREKAQQVQARQSRARLVRRASIAASVIAVVAIAGVVITWAVSTTGPKPLVQPANVVDDGFAVTAISGLPAEAAAADPANPTPSPTPAAETATPTPEATPTEAPAVDIRVYVDYLSAGAKEFQAANAQQLSTWVNEDAATLTYYPVAMLTAKSNGTKYSLRAASAAACVATYSPDSFFLFNHALLTEQQPEIDSDGLTDTDLANLAIATGSASPKVVRSCIEGEKFATWAKTATERALQGLPGTKDVALTATPMILVNGTPYVGSLNDPAEFAQFVLTIASDAYYQTPTPTPTPSDSTATPTPTPTPTSTN